MTVVHLEGGDRALAPTDEEAEEAAAEHAAAFADFYREHYDRTVRLAWLLTSSPRDAEDLTQDAFVELDHRFEDLRVPGAYLRTAIINRCRRWQRREARSRERMRALRAEQMPEMVEIPDPDDDLLEAVAGLPYRQRAVLVCRYWAGWSEAEIADALGCRPGTVKSLAARALDAVRKELDEREAAVDATNPFGEAVAATVVQPSVTPLPGTPSPPRLEKEPDPAPHPDAPDFTRHPDAPDSVAPDWGDAYWTAPDEAGPAEAEAAPAEAAPVEGRNDWAEVDEDWAPPPDPSGDHEPSGSHRPAGPADHFEGEDR